MNESSRDRRIEIAVHKRPFCHGNMTYVATKTAYLHVDVFELLNKIDRSFVASTIGNNELHRYFGRWTMDSHTFFSIILFIVLL